LKFQDFPKETQECILDNYGAIDFKKGVLLKISDNCDIELTEDETCKVVKMLEKRLRKELLIN